MKKNRYFLPLMALMCSVFIITACVLGNNTVDGLGAVRRLGGSNRTETACIISDEGWADGAKNVVIANGYSYPDAMAGAPLAALLDAPILLTRGDNPEEAILSQLMKLGCENVYILGGESSISKSFAEQIELNGYFVERLAGDSRYDTAAVIAEKMISLGAKVDSAFIASGVNFPDALSASSASGILGRPILYATQQGELNSSTLNVISNSDIASAIILGGTAAISENAESALINIGISDVNRIFGADRYQTSLAVNKYFSDVFSSTDIILAQGENFPDALSGGAFAAKNHIPVLLINNTHNIPGAFEYVTEQNSSTIYVLGLEGALTSYAVDTFLSGGTITTSTTTTTTTILPATTTTTKAPSTGKKAYLTFDDGPSANTTKILDILDKYNVKATFFVIYREGYENTYKEIVRHGHTIALHSYSHNYAKIYSSKSAYFNDLNKLSDYVERLTGVKSKILRFPGGGSNTVSRNHCKGIMTTLTKEVQARGYHYFDWNVDSCDASDIKVNAATIVANVKRGCGNMKSVNILMHDAPSKTTTVTALPEIIEYLLSKGYEILPITEDTPQVHHAVNN